MTSRSYFGKMNSILGSVVPLAMFFLKPEQVLEVPVRREPREIGIFHQQMSREKTPKQSDVGFENLKGKDLNANSIMKRGTHTWTVLLLSK